MGAVAELEPVRHVVQDALDGPLGVAELVRDLLGGQSGRDEPEDLGLPYWTGVVPVAPAYAAPVPAPYAGAEPQPPVPAYLSPGSPRGVSPHATA